MNMKRGMLAAVFNDKVKSKPHYSQKSLQPSVIEDGPKDGLYTDTQSNHDQNL